MPTIHAARSVTVWTVNLAAFWLAEILTSYVPGLSEPVAVLALALAVYLMVGVAGALAATVARQVLRRPQAVRRLLMHDRALAFAPGTVLLLVQLRVAMLWSLASALVVVLLVVAGCTAWFLVARGRGGGRTGESWSLGTLPYGLLSLGLWMLALRIKVVVAVAGAHRSDLAVGLSGSLVIAAAGLAWGLYLGYGPPPARRWRRRLAAAVSLLAVLGVQARAWWPEDVSAPAGTSAAEAVDRGLPPIVVIVLDTTRADHLSVYGYDRDTSPELARFAADAVVFDNAVSTSSWTLPAHASLFTGLYPSTHGASRRPVGDTDSASAGQVSKLGLPLGLDTYTLAEWLRDAGYATGAVIANYAYLDPAFRLDQGFHFYDSLPSSPVAPRILRVIHRRLRPIPGAEKYWQHYRLADQVNFSARRWLAARETRQIFLFLNYMEPHLPWGSRLTGPRYAEFAAQNPDGQLLARGGRQRLEMQRRVDRYDSQIVSMDAELGRFLDHLRRLDLYDDALIVVTSDHGESFGERSAYGHGVSLEEAEVHVPLLIKYPGSRHTGRSSERVQLVDLLPTLAREIGKAFPEDVEGDPIGAVDHPILAEVFLDPETSRHGWEGYQAALYDGDRKLLVWADGGMELIDLSASLEAVDIAPDLEPWARRQARELLERKHLLLSRFEDPEGGDLDPEVREKLKALGYL